MEPKDAMQPNVEAVVQAVAELQRAQQGLMDALKAIKASGVKRGPSELYSALGSLETALDEGKSARDYIQSVVGEDGKI